MLFSKLQFRAEIEGMEQPRPKRSKWEEDEEDDKDLTTLRKNKKVAKKKAAALRSQSPGVTPTQPPEIDPLVGPEQTSSKSCTASPLAEARERSSQSPLLPPTSSSPRRYSPAPALSKAAFPTLSECRSVDNYEKLNKIEEGAYGVVYRARNKETGEIVALKRLKLEKERNGFPVTSLREIHTLLLAKHPNIVDVKEIVVGKDLTQIFIVMEFVEHDLRSLMEGMRTPFLQSEIKTLMLQLLSAVALLHENWFVHRDLKTSNLLMNNRGMIKVADFGLARKYGSPLGPMTQLVVTLWYRSPELLLGAKEYSTAVDMWSVGCIFGELVNKEPLFPGKSEIDQLNKIFQLLGVPNEEIWPGWSKLPNAQNVSFVKQSYNYLRTRFPYLTNKGLDLLSGLLTYDPEKRMTAEEALKHPYFSEPPLPKDPSLFPTWPSKASGEKRKTFVSPSAPQVAHARMNETEDEDSGLAGSIFDTSSVEASAGFRLKI
ncbi:uncharacterized protein VTP21DRAFT_5701 [Calcarisporiella thermophila]|uniref:uncharacterized protein n=1 Tax=Calcarisporiella thermophila TaxID=911321 RepID=UPI003743E86F